MSMNINMFNAATRIAYNSSIGGYNEYVDYIVSKHTSVYYALDYGSRVGRLKYGERAILDYGLNALVYRYARDVIKGRFKLGESLIMNSEWKYNYLSHLKRCGMDDVIDQLETQYEW